MPSNSALIPLTVIRRTWLSTAAIAFAAVAATTCGDDTLTAPSDSVITVVASSPTVALNGFVDVTATLVKANGVPVDDGTPVTFVCCSPTTTGSPQTLNASGVAAQAGSSSLGSMDPAIAVTQDGKATARFTAGTRAGTAHIAVIAGGARPGSVQLAIGGIAATKLVLAANPPAIPSGTGVVDISATVMDGAGNGVSGVDVTFAGSSGTLLPAIATSGANGVATTRLTTNREAVVVATAGTQSATITIRLAPVPTLSVSVTPQALTAGQVAQFAFTAVAATAGAPLRNLAVDFGDGSQTTITGLAGTTVVAHPYASSGSFTIISTLTDISGERAIATTILSVLPRPSMTVTLEVVGGTTPTVGNPVVFNAIVGPTSEIPRISRLEWDFGDGTDATTNGTSTSHIFAATGPRTIKVTVVTSDNARFTTQAVILVKAVPQ